MKSRGYLEEGDDGESQGAEVRSSRFFVICGIRDHVCAYFRGGRTERARSAVSNGDDVLSDDHRAPDDNLASTS